MLTEKTLPARMRAVATAARLAVVAAALAVIGGCSSTMYLLQAANGEWHVIHARKPIVQVIDNPQTPQHLVRELEEVRAARNFASRVLKLPDNDSYRTYVKIDRPYVVWNVVAAPALSVQPKQWCFPVAGCVAYRGYFSEKRAREFARRLQRRGYDVVVEGVPTYSTLGKLPDPVMSTMMRYGSDELASMIFHELAHQLLYVKNDSRFDEAFAVTVENAGLKRWLEYRGKPARMIEYEKQRAADRQFITLLRRARDRLAQLYAAAAPRQAKLQRKRQVFAGLAADIRALEHRLTIHSPLYDKWIAEGFNNADLASVSTYYDCVPGFERLLRRQSGDLPRFYAAARKLAREPRALRDAQLCANAAAPSGSVAGPRRPRGALGPRTVAVTATAADPAG
ncbi:MAG TPA: aminopeptidase [Steroidobacteraceae bacterium]|jgi:predicted aminopeptidase|nr:aminopeptidase [Steroidobacteraceae bacterium]